MEGSTEFSPWFRIQTSVKEAPDCVQLEDGYGRLDSGWLLRSLAFFLTVLL